ncbi:marine proteobacterial sortase target protein [Wenzhouxiangella sp. XN79A]|uniref:marine proteobacterial sortase target protein n=1 Tax=Wenzhouxiangella sp. XN79A TaxID=2724193 RepID=UPI00144A93BA|nr:marine proteobacterial sortase target protein [Wenzhouxiangella sp. XN79A]NKI34493.1 marine proteobacterial sortase target protein [Wenzhouxiangella sp. XN79A]
MTHCPFALPPGGSHRPRAAVLALVLSAFLSIAYAHATSSDSTARLLLDTANGVVPALALSTEVRTEVTGLLARTTIRHRFGNPSADWVEGRYQFPLPDGAAVDRLAIEIGDRRIEGEIQARAAARATFESARAEGRTAGLVEQQRPGLFTTDVANIGPGEQVTVEIGFGHRVDYRHGRFTLRLPMTLLPRYARRIADPASTFGPIEPDLPAGPRYTEHPVNPLTLSIELRPGPELATLDSLHHAVDLAPDRHGGWTIRLDEPAPVVDRDFELEWTLMERERLTGAFYVEEFDGRAHALLMLVPPAAWTPVQRRRELVLVIDASGSMQGAAIEQARSALHAALERLQPGDRFNVIAFNDRAMPLFDAPKPVGPTTLAEGHRFIDGLRADRGTEMDEALRLALADPPADGRLRQVVFATDGAIAGEQAVLDRVRRDLGDSRLFAIGIGHGVNAPFLRALARHGRGTHTLLHDPGQLARNVTELMDQLERPALERLALDWPVPDEAWPVLLPDLYAGEPLMVLTRLDAPLSALHGQAVELMAERAGEPVRQRWPLDRFHPASGVAREWARQKVAGVLDFARDDADADGLRAHALDVALRYQVLSPVTSLVAVDRTPGRSAEAALRAAGTGHDRPHGRTLGLPQTATSAARAMAAGLVALLMAGLLLVAPRLQRPHAATVGR